MKRRSDGSRYVVRRAVRGEVLKKREAEINRERTGISTDDDAMSDLKVIQNFLIYCIVFEKIPQFVNGVHRYIAQLVIR